MRWDASKPNGQPRRKLDVSRAKERFGFEAKTTSPTGVRKLPISGWPSKGGNKCLLARPGDLLLCLPSHFHYESEDLGRYALGLVG